MSIATTALTAYSRRDRSRRFHRCAFALQLEAVDRRDFAPDAARGGLREGLRAEQARNGEQQDANYGHDGSLRSKPLRTVAGGSYSVCAQPCAGASFATSVANWSIYALQNARFCRRESCPRNRRGPGLKEMYASPPMTVTPRMPRICRRCCWPTAVPIAPNDVPVIAAVLPRQTFRSVGFEPQSIAFFSTAGSERLCSGVTNSSAGPPATSPVNRSTAAGRFAFEILVVHRQVVDADQA